MMVSKWLVIWSQMIISCQRIARIKTSVFGIFEHSFKVFSQIIVRFRNKMSDIER